MVRFAAADTFEKETLAADPCGEAPVVARKRRSRRANAPGFEPTNPLLQQAFPSWARPPKQPAVGADARGDAAFYAGAGLALLDQILRTDPPFAGALRQRLALRAAIACAALARHREDEGALRDAEHLSPGAGETSPAGRMHRLWRCFAALPVGFDQQNLRRAADLLELPQAFDLEALSETLQQLAQGKKNPLAAATRAASMTMQARIDAPRVETEIFALWLADLTLALRLGWAAPVPLLAMVSHIHRCAAAPPASVRVPAMRIGRTLLSAPMRWPPGTLSPWLASCRADRNRCWRRRRNCAQRVPVGSSNVCWTTTPCRRRAPRNWRVSPIAPRVACSIG